MILEVGDPAIKEINEHTDIIVSYAVAKKEKKKVQSVVFSIAQKKQIKQREKREAKQRTLSYDEITKRGLAGAFAQKVAVMNVFST